MLWDGQLPGAHGQLSRPLELLRREPERERAETGESGGWNWRKRLRREREATSRRELEGDKEEGELRSEGNGDKY